MRQKAMLLAWALQAATADISMPSKSRSGLYQRERELGIELVDRQCFSMLEMSRSSA